MQTVNVTPTWEAQASILTTLFEINVSLGNSEPREYARHEIVQLGRDIDTLQAANRDLREALQALHKAVTRFGACYPNLRTEEAIKAATATIERHA